MPFLVNTLSAYINTLYDSQPAHRHQHKRAAVTKVAATAIRDRQHTDCHGDVDKRMGEQQGGDTDAQQPAYTVGCHQRRAQSAADQDSHKADDRQGADESCFFGDDRKDEVVRRHGARQEAQNVLGSLAESFTPQAAGSDCNL